MFYCSFDVVFSNVLDFIHSFLIHIHSAPGPPTPGSVLDTPALTLCIALCNLCILCKCKCHSEFAEQPASRIDTQFEK